jgi:WD40 repeat protein
MMKWLFSISIYFLFASNLFSAEEYKWMKKGTNEIPGNCEITPDGKYFAIGGDMFLQLIIYDTETGFVKRDLSDGNTPNILLPTFPFDFSKDSKNIIYPVFGDSSKFQICRVTNIETGELVSELSFTKSEFDARIYISKIHSINNSEVLIFFADHTNDRTDIIIWNYSTNTITARKTMTDGKIKFIKPNNNLNIIYAVTENNELLIYSKDDISLIQKMNLNLQNGDILHFVNVSESGQYLAIGVINQNDNCPIRIYNTTNGNLIKSIPENYFSIYLTNGVFFINDDKTLAYITGGYIKTVDVLGTAQPELSSTKVGGEEFRIINNDKIVVYSKTSGNANIVDWHSGTNILSFTDIQLRVRCVDFSYDDKYIIFLQGEQLLKSPGILGLLNPVTGQGINTKKAYDFDYRYWFITSPNRYELVYPSIENDLVILNYVDGDEIARLKGHTGIIISMRYSQDGKSLITTSEDNTIKIWDLESKNIIFDYLHNKPLKFTNFTLNPSQIFIIESINKYSDNFIIYDKDNRVIVKEKISNVNCCGFYRPNVAQTSDLKTLAFSGSKSQIWNLEDLSFHYEVKNPNKFSNISIISYSKNDLFLTGSYSDDILIWDITGKLVKNIKDFPRNLEMPGYSSYSIAVSHDNKYILTSNSFKYLTLWNAPDITSVDEKELASDVTYVYPNPAREIVNIQIPFSGAEYTYEVYDILGQSIMKNKVQFSSDILTIPVNHLQSGTYMCRILVNNQVFLNKYFIIQK